jgi:hypothetical protein
MDQAIKTFPDGLPNLAQLATYNKGKDVPVETSWIWGSDDEVGGRKPSFSEVASADYEQRSVASIS